MGQSSFVCDTADRMRRRKINRRGFQLKIMVCGRSGTGKSTFINTLCDGEVLDPSVMKSPPSTRELTVRSHPVELGESDGTVISLTVVDTPGFGDKLDNSEASTLILRYLEDQFDAVLLEELRIRRDPGFQDNRIHACLYFIPPTGKGLRELDLDLMQTISSRVNIIPVIAKADMMTDQELLEFKRRVMADIRERNIPIVDFPYDPEDQEGREEALALQGMLPFAVVGSNTIYEVDNEYVRGRNYPWGFVRVEDPMHSDFVALRSVLFGSHIQELRDSTESIIYERYRTEKLSEDPTLAGKLQEQLQREMANRASMRVNSEIQALPRALGAASSLLNTASYQRMPSMQGSLPGSLSGLTGLPLPPAVPLVHPASRGASTAVAAGSDIFVPSGGDNI